MTGYAEFAVTTNFSFLRGASHGEELVLQAKELGLVDQLGGFYDAVDKAKQLAGVSGEARLKRMSPNNSPFEALQKMAPSQRKERIALMEQALLADRFKLKVHFESREMTVYALAAAKAPHLRAPRRRSHYQPDRDVDR